MSDGSFPPKDILSSHAVHSKSECSWRCLQKSTCVGHNYRVKSNKYAENCQLSNKTQDRDNNKNGGDWTFYQDLHETVSIVLLCYTLYIHYYLSFESKFSLE